MRCIFCGFPYDRGTICPGIITEWRECYPEDGFDCRYCGKVSQPRDQCSQRHIIAGIFLPCTP